MIPKMKAIVYLELAGIYLESTWNPPGQISVAWSHFQKVTLLSKNASQWRPMKAIKLLNLGELFLLESFPVI